MSCDTILTILMAMKALFVSCLLAATWLPENSDGFRHTSRSISTTALDAILPRKQSSTPITPATSTTEAVAKPLRQANQRSSVSTSSGASSSSASSSSAPSLLKKISSRSVKRVAVSAEQDDAEPESAQEQLAKLEAAAAANKDEWDALLKAKLEEWKDMKAAGILDKLMIGDEEVSEEVIAEMDDMSKRLLRRQRGKGISTKPESGPDQEGTSKEQLLFELREKLVIVGGTKDGSSLGTYSLLNEIKDKSMIEADPKLVEDTLLALTRLDSSSMAVSGFKMYQKWIAEGRLQPFGGGPGVPPTVVTQADTFGVAFANACFATSLELCEAGRKVMELLIAEGSAAEAFLPGMACAAAYEAPSSHPKGAAGKGSGVVTADLVDALSALKKELKRFRPDQVNPVIRALGRRRLTPLVFDFLDAMRAQGVAPNDESLEFLANALVVTVNEDAKAKSMKDLPDPDLSMPEIVFVGRSNVGKSSLVNFLVNRKALASVDPTPGHTTQFHFFGVNRDRTDLPSFYLVDVPGLGYAEADEGRQVRTVFSTLYSGTSTLFRPHCLQDINT